MRQLIASLVRRLEELRKRKKKKVIGCCARVGCAASGERFCCRAAREKMKLSSHMNITHHFALVQARQ
jgi:hypothetical protein